MSFVSLDNISVSYQTKAVKKGSMRLNRFINFGIVKSENFILKNFSVRLVEGDVLALKGASGVGKTTLMRVIIGCLPVSSGSVEVSGKVYSMMGRDFIEHKSTVMQNILLNGYRMGLSGKELKTYKSKVIDGTGSTELLNQPFNLLPKVYKNKLIDNLRVANVISSDICLVDLPQLIKQETILEEILTKSKIAILSTSHKGIIEKYCNKQLNLKDY